jgi:hypothetical protein
MHSLPSSLQAVGRTKPMPSKFRRRPIEIEHVEFRVTELERGAEAQMKKP